MSDPYVRASKKKAARRKAKKKPTRKKAVRKKVAKKRFVEKTKQRVEIRIETVIRGNLEDFLNGTDTMLQDVLEDGGEIKDVRVY